MFQSFHGGTGARNEKERNVIYKGFPSSEQRQEHIASCEYCGSRKRVSPGLTCGSLNEDTDQLETRELHESKVGGLPSEFHRSSQAGFTDY